MSWHLNPNDPDFFELLVGSFERVVGKKLVERHQGPEWLYGHAPFSIVAHNSEPRPVFVYANVPAQRHFGYSWREFINLSPMSPSELLREEVFTEEAISMSGYQTRYRALGVTKSGLRFRLEDGLMWQLRDPAGQNLGHATVFSKWVEVN